jgi:hypothetical protein
MAGLLAGFSSGAASGARAPTDAHVGAHIDPGGARGELGGQVCVGMCTCVRACVPMFSSILPWLTVLCGRMGFKILLVRSSMPDRFEQRVLIPSQSLLVSLPIYCVDSRWRVIRSRLVSFSGHGDLDSINLISNS